MVIKERWRLMKNFILFVLLFLSVYSWKDFRDMAVISKSGDTVYIKTKNQTWVRADTENFKQFESGEKVKIYYRDVYFDNSPGGVTKWMKFYKLQKTGS